MITEGTRYSRIGNTRPYPVYTRRHDKRAKLTKDYGIEKEPKFMLYLYTGFIISLILLIAMIIADIVYESERTRISEAYPVYVDEYETVDVALPEYHARLLELIEVTPADELIFIHDGINPYEDFALYDEIFLSDDGLDAFTHMIDIQDTERYIWKYLSKIEGLNDYAKAGFMANWWAESRLIPNNLQNSYERKLGYTDDEYTDIVDSGDYQQFTSDKAGYGICQWTYWSRKKGLLEMAVDTNRSISDIDLQLEYFEYELTGMFADLYDRLKDVKSIEDASDMILMEFENPDGCKEEDANSKFDRRQYAREFYERYTK